MTLKWLDKRLEEFLSAIASLTTAEETQVKELVEAEINAWKERPTMKNERSLRNPMYFARRALEEIPLTLENSWHNPRYDRREHIALKYMDFSPQEWTAYNESTTTQLQTRLQNSQFLEDPDAIVHTADALLLSDDWATLVAGLVVNTGRRHTELMKTANFVAKSAYSLMFSGQLKTAGQVVFEIPTFSLATKVIAALLKLREKVDTTQLNNTQINQKYSGAVIEAIERHFTNLVPHREGKDNLYTHLFRAVYGRMAVWYYCPPQVADIFYMATIQGHYRFLNSDDQEYRLNFASTAHYYDYQISDRLIASHRGVRQGIWLDRPGVQLLECLKSESASVDQTSPSLSSSPTPEEQTEETESVTAAEPPTSEELKPPTQQQPLSALASTAITLLKSSSYTQVLTALIALTGRSPSELIKSGQFSLNPDDTFSLIFSHQIASHQESIATLAPGADILEAIATLRKHPNLKNLPYLSPHEILHHCLPHITRITKKYFHLNNLDELIKAYADATGAETAPLLNLIPSKTTPKSAIYHIWDEDKPRLSAIADRFQTSSQADTTARTLQLAETCLIVAQLLDIEPEQLESTLESILAKNQQLEQQLRTQVQPSSAPEPVSPLRAISQSLSLSTSPLEQSPLLEALAKSVSSLAIRLSHIEQQLHTQAQTIPPNQSARPPAPETHKTLTSPLTSISTSATFPPSSRRNSADAKIARAVNALMIHNDRCSSNNQRWAVTESAIAHLTGCNRPAVKRYFHSHREAIERHNRRYQFSSRHNAKLSRQKKLITQAIRF